MKQNTLGSVKPESGSLPQANRCTLVNDEVSMLLDLGRPMRNERSNIAEFSEIVCSAKQTAKVAHGLKRETCHFPYLLGLIKECHPPLRHEWVAQRTGVANRKPRNETWPARCVIEKQQLALEVLTVR